METNQETRSTKALEAATQTQHSPINNRTQSSMYDPSADLAYKTVGLLW